MDRKKGKVAIKGPKEDGKQAQKKKNPEKEPDQSDHVGQLQQKAVDENLDKEMDVLNQFLSEDKQRPHNVADPRDITMLDRQSGAQQRPDRDMFSDHKHSSNFLQNFDPNDAKIPDIYSQHNDKKDDSVTQKLDAVFAEEGEKEHALNIPFGVEERLDDHLSQVLDEINRDSVQHEVLPDIDTIRDIVDEEEGVNEGEEDKDIQEGEQQEATNAEEFKKPKLVKNKRKMEDKVTQIQN